MKRVNIYRILSVIRRNKKGDRMEGNNKEVKHRIKNLTGEYVLIMKDGTVKFDLYPDEKKSQS